MSSLVKPVKPDRGTIDIMNPKELKYWTKALDASKEEVLHAIEKVGNSAAAVRKELVNRKPLEPDDFPLNADGKNIKKQDSTQIAETFDPTVAMEVADRLNEEETRREEDSGRPRRTSYAHPVAELAEMAVSLSTSSKWPRAPPRSAYFPRSSVGRATKGGQCCQMSRRTWVVH
jgi:hypothetical protein